MNERDITIDAIARVLGGERSDEVVPAALASSPHFDNEMRARVARRVYGVGVLRLRLAFRAGIDLVATARTAGDVAAALLTEYERDVENGEPAQRAWPSDPVERIVVERSCPRPIVDALLDGHHREWVDAFLATSNQPGPKTLRTNTLKCTRDELRERLARDDRITTRTDTIDLDGPFARDALVVVEESVGPRANLFGSRAWRDGWFEVQDAASQVVVELCQAKPRDVVVDYCAGRGGKTLALAAAIENDGTVYVNDVDVHALADMKPRLKRAGVTCVSDAMGAALLAACDVVLVDAPCSSLGVLRRSPDLRWRFDPARDLEAVVATQARVLRDAAPLVKPGGKLVYAVCSVLVAEGEVAARAFVGERTARSEAWSIDEMRTLAPHDEGTDGFFVAVLRRE